MTNFIITESQYNRILEANSKLLNSSQTFAIPMDLYNHLCDIYDKYKDVDNIGMVDGFKRLKTMIKNKSFNYNTLRRIKNYFDTVGDKSENNISYILNGGAEMETWVNERLDQAENSTKSTYYNYQGYSNPSSPLEQNGVKYIK